MWRLSWFLDPGGWSKTAAVRLYFIFPGICTLSLVGVGSYILFSHPYWSVDKFDLVDVLAGNHSCYMTKFPYTVVVITATVDIMCAIAKSC
ncbi:hypothetical protein STEG23_009934 [Scotinomys teguina]